MNTKFIAACSVATGAVGALTGYFSHLSTSAPGLSSSESAGFGALVGAQIPTVAAIAKKALFPSKKTSCLIARGTVATGISLAAISSISYGVFHAAGSSLNYSQAVKHTCLNGLYLTGCALVATAIGCVVDRISDQCRKPQEQTSPV